MTTGFPDPTSFQTGSVDPVTTKSSARLATKTKRHKNLFLLEQELLNKYLISKIRPELNLAQDAVHGEIIIGSSGSPSLIFCFKKTCCSIDQCAPTLFWSLVRHTAFTVQIKGNQFGTTA